MTIATTSSSVTSLGNGVTTSFNYSFLIPYQADGVTPAVAVYIIDTSGGLTILPLGQFVISGVGNAAGGTVSYTPGGIVTALPNGYAIVIERDLVYNQPTQVTNQAFLPHTCEQMGDRETMQVQQLALGVSRSVRVGPGEVLDALPPKATRANKVLGFDATGALQLFTTASSFVLANFINYVRTATGAVSRTVTSKLDERPTPMDFGGQGNGVADDRAAVALADADGSFRLPMRKVFRIGTSLVINSDVVIEPGASFSVDAGATLTVNGRIFYQGVRPAFTGAGTFVMGALNTTMAATAFGGTAANIAPGVQKALDSGVREVLYPPFDCFHGTQVNIPGGTRVTIVFTGHTVTVAGSISMFNFLRAATPGTGVVLNFMMNGVFIGESGGLSTSVFLNFNGTFTGPAGSETALYTDQFFNFCGPHEIRGFRRVVLMGYASGWMNDEGTYRFNNVVAELTRGASFFRLRGFGGFNGMSVYAHDAFGDALSNGIDLNGWIGVGSGGGGSLGDVYVQNFQSLTWHGGSSDLCYGGSYSITTIGGIDCYIDIDWCASDLVTTPAHRGVLCQASVRSIYNIGSFANQNVGFVSDPGTLGQGFRTSNKFSFVASEGVVNCNMLDFGSRDNQVDFGSIRTKCPRSGANYEIFATGSTDYWDIKIRSMVTPSFTLPSFGANTPLPTAAGTPPLRVNFF
jgi:hypothetical protein